jgi:hypothetical protein
MTKADRQQNFKNGFCGGVGDAPCGNCAQFDFARHFAKAGRLKQ